MSYRVEVITNGEGNWVSNRLRFATYQEAVDYCCDFNQRWAAWVTDSRVVESDDPVNYRYIDNQLYMPVPHKCPVPAINS